jgi:nitrate reductase assembly molybdenum cofactor insertion protein NarJ
MGRGGGGKVVVGLIYLYKMLSLGLSYPEEENWAIIERVLMMSEDILEGEMLSSVNRFKEYFLGNRHRIDDIKSEYLATFDIGREISPYETEYIREKVSRKPFELADIAGFYTAFGFSINEDMRNKEALDHISIELEFMAILEWKGQYALEKEEEENAKIVKDARMKFLKDHLAKWGFFYCRQIHRLEGDGLYKRLGRILELVLALECERYSIDVSLFDKQMGRDPYNGVRGEELTC